MIRIDLGAIKACSCNEGTRQLPADDECSCQLYATLRFVALLRNLRTSIVVTVQMMFLFVMFCQRNLKGRGTTMASPKRIASFSTFDQQYGVRSRTPPNKDTTRAGASQNT